MQRDFKIGLAIGIVAAAGAVLWLSTRPKLSTESRALKTASPPPAAPAPSAVIPEPQIPKPAQPQEMQPADNVQPARYHIVQKGDTLSAISQKYYGSARYQQKIFSANSNVLKDPDRLIPGTRLLIPDL